MSGRTMIVYEPVKARLVKPRARLRLSGKDIEFMALTLVDRYMPLPPEPEEEGVEMGVMEAITA